MMKGYSETRGQSSKLNFDSATGHFVSTPIAHDFETKPPLNIIVQKLGELRQLHQRKKAKQQATKILSELSPHLRDDLGMTEFFARTSQS
jgi:hypothetical protein